MPRRRLEPHDPDRLAIILGIPPVVTAPAALPEPAGWVPQRASFIRPEALAPPPGQVLTESHVQSPVRFTPSKSGRHRRTPPPKPAILTVPNALRGIRATPGRLAVLGVLVVLATSAVLLGVRVAWARSAAQPRPVAPAAHGPPVGLVTRTIPAAFASKGAAAGLPATAAILLVHVVGQIRRPGVVRLPAGSRVLDAVQAAGGPSASADLNHLNLARPLVDGEQIVVPKPGENVPAAGLAGSAGGGIGPTPGLSAGGLIDLNTADANALDSLPGIGPVIAQRILDWRGQHGRFSSVDELGEVSGIGDKLMAQIAPKVRV